MSLVYKDRKGRERTIYGNGGYGFYKLMQQQTPMQVNIAINEATILKVVESIMANFPEASFGCALRCIHWRYSQWKWTFEDTETGKVYKLDKAKVLAAFPLMYTDKWPKGLTPPPASNDLEEVWDNWLTQADAVYHDAFAQLACLGEVPYG